MKARRLHQGFLLLLFPVLAWFIYVYATGAIIAEKLEQKPVEITPSSIGNAIRLTADASAALAGIYINAGTAEQLDKAAQLGREALAHNPTNGRVAAQLLYLYSQKDDQTEKTRILADLSGRLWTSHTYTHSQLADYWARQGRIDKLIIEWNILLTRNTSFRKQLFPTLEQIILHPEYSNLLDPYIAVPPAWWGDFFHHVSMNPDISLVRHLYEQRSRAGVSPNDSERLSFINRLLKDKQWQEAHGIWKDTLSTDQQKLLGSVFDGGFEGNLAGTGFDWQLRATQALQIKPDVIRGMSGNKALHITLRKDKRINFQNVSQQLLLSPGAYHFNIRYRVDRLKTTKGLRWRVRCLDDANTVLTESKPIIGKTPWENLASTFTVPVDTCPTQILRLEADSKYAHDHIFDGSLWFDNAVIEKADSDKIQ